MRVNKAIIPAAGRGTRFLPATKVIPKEMLPIVDAPAIQYVVEEAASFQLENIQIITGRGKDAIIDHFDRAPELEQDLRLKGKDTQYLRTRHSDQMADISFVRQPNPAGLGDAILRSHNFTGKDHFAVLLGDDLLNESSSLLGRMIEVAEATGDMVVGVMKVPTSEISKYGCVELSTDFSNEAKAALVTGLVEKPQPDDAPSEYAVIGRYVLGPRVFDAIKLAGIGAGDEIQLTDALDLIAKRPDKYGRLWAVEIDGERYDVGDKLSWLKTNIAFGLRSEFGDDLKKYVREVCMSLES